MRGERKEVFEPERESPSPLFSFFPAHGNHHRLEQLTREGKEKETTFVFKQGYPRHFVSHCHISSIRMSDADESFSDPEEDEDYNLQDYYEGNDQDLPECLEIKNDPESHEFECLLVADVEKLLNESVEHISSQISVTPSLAKVSLMYDRW